MKKNKWRLKDVAKLADVSVGSVSRYINNNPSVSKENANKIQQAINELGYVPNRAAQNLAKGVSNNLLLYILQEDPMQASTWLYKLAIMQRIYDYIKNTDYSLQVAMDYLEDKEGVVRTLGEYINSNRADGMIVLSAWGIGKANLTRLNQSKLPFVLIGNQNMIESTNEILFDNFSAINEVMDHLYDLGHRNIAFINGMKRQEHMIQRGRAYFASLQRLGLELNREWIKNGQHSLESGILCMEEILDCDKQPTAVVCSNDDMAAGAIKAIKERGLSVPDDYSITGFDDSIISKIVEPSLTTVHIPLQELADLGIERLIDIIEKRDKIESNEMLYCQVIRRASTGKAKLC